MPRIGHGVCFSYGPRQLVTSQFPFSGWFYIDCGGRGHRCGSQPKGHAMFDILGELVDNSLLRKDQNRIGQRSL